MEIWKALFTNLGIDAPIPTTVEEGKLVACITKCHLGSNGKRPLVRAHENIGAITENLRNLATLGGDHFKIATAVVKTLGHRPPKPLRTDRQFQEIVRLSSSALRLG